MAGAPRRKNPQRPRFTPRAPIPKKPQPPRVRVKPPAGSFDAAYYPDGSRGFFTRPAYPSTGKVIQPSSVGEGYFRAEVTAPDPDGFSWIVPSRTAWPNVKGDPPGPRTQVVGYNPEEKTVRTVFRDGTPWRYEQVPPEVWERLRRTASTGRFINRVLNGYPYRRDQFLHPFP